LCRATRADRAAEALGRQAARRLPARTPPHQRCDDSKIGDGIEPERRGNPQGGDDHPAKRRADCTADVDTDAVGSDRGIEVLPGNEPRHDRLPRRRRQRAGHSDQKREQQQIAGSCQIEGDDHCEDRGENGCCYLRDNEKFSPIEDIGKRAGRHREQEHRQGGRDLDHGNDERLRIEARHQPARRGVVHPAADVGDDGRNPQHRVFRVPERAPWRGCRSGGRLRAGHRT